MKVTIVSVGKLKEKYLKQGIEEYTKRLGRYCKFEIIEVKDEEVPENLSEKEQELVRNREGERILAKIPDQAYTVVLAIDGKPLSSEELAKMIEQATIQGKSHFVFVIGGSIGTSTAVEQRANLKLSFGKMTLPHQLMRLVLTEQIYRSFRIMNNEPYHK